MKKDPFYWASLRLHRILSQVARRLPSDPPASLWTLLQTQKAVERGSRLYQRARARGWTLVAEILFSRLVSDIAAVHAASRSPYPLPPAAASAVPALADILAELKSLREEFDEVDVLPKEKVIQVTTTPVTLEDIGLGPFSIRLHFERLTTRRDASAFEIVAEQPNAAAGDSSCTHPHVRGDALCAGDASFPIANALNEGRIGDAFQLVNRVLHTYNPGSAYVDLDSWDGVGCADCGYTTSTNDLYCCEHCGQDFCDDCTRTCERCDQSVCLGYAIDAHDQRLCPTCKELADEESEKNYENENEDKDKDKDEEEPAAVPDDSVHRTAAAEPYPPTETPHAHFQPDCSGPPAADLPGGTAVGAGNPLLPNVPATSAA